jgi:hypothetical protein
VRVVTVEDGRLEEIEVGRRIEPRVLGEPRAEGAGDPCGLGTSIGHHQCLHEQSHRALAVGEIGRDPFDVGDGAGVLADGDQGGCPVLLGGVGGPRHRASASS